MFEKSNPVPEGWPSRRRKTARTFPLSSIAAAKSKNATRACSSGPAALNSLRVGCDGFSLFGPGYRVDVGIVLEQKLRIRYVINAGMRLMQAMSIEFALPP